MEYKLLHLVETLSPKPELQYAFMWLTRTSDMLPLTLIMLFCFMHCLKMEYDLVQNHELISYYRSNV